MQSSWLNVVSHIDPKYGGIVAALPPLTEAVASVNGHRVTLAAFCAKDERVDPNRNKLVPAELFPLGKKAWMSSLHSWKRFTETVQRNDGVHIHGLWQEHCAISALLARRSQKPYVISAHGMLERWAVQHRKVKKAAYSMLVENRNLRYARCLHALTCAEAEDYRRAGLRNPIAIIPNGVQVPVNISADLFLQRFPDLRNKKLVLFLGRIHYKKGLDLLCRAWKAIRPQSSDMHLVIAGPDFENTRQSLETLIHELNISQHITFTGMLSGPLKWSAFRASSLFVLPSYSEGLSVSVLEAAGLGIPVIITEACNMPEVVSSGCGWEIPAKEDAIIEALRYFMAASSAELHSMGQNGRQLVEQRFSWPVIGRKMASIYEYALGASQPSGVEFRPALG